jgi:methanogenic corrinoid protein MtbC1
VKIIVGGQAFRASPDLWRTIGADAGASDPLEAAATAAALVGL